MRVHVYRNRADDKRGPSEMFFCHDCGGWYGVPHDLLHCQERMTGRVPNCACRFCRERDGLSVKGAYGFLTVAKKWQPEEART